MRRRAGLGLDGCRGGWVLALLGADGRPDFALLPRIEALDALLAARPGPAPRGLVDVPIGLPLAGERSVDAAAKALLGSAAASVFTIPPRPVLDALDFPEAQLLARAAMGKGFSIQAWNILPKIREVDLWLRRRGPGFAPLREAHPELVFRGLARLAGTEPPGAAKKTPAGRAQRLAILGALDVDTGAVTAMRAGTCTAAPDDVLDALALAAAARLPDRSLATLPRAPETDPLGLPMEMVIPRALLAD